MNRFAVLSTAHAAEMKSQRAGVGQQLDSNDGADRDYRPHISPGCSKRSPVHGSSAGTTQLRQTPQSASGRSSLMSDLMYLGTPTKILQLLVACDTSSLTSIDTLDDSSARMTALQTANEESSSMEAQLALNMQDQLGTLKPDQLDQLHTTVRVYAEMNTLQRERDFFEGKMEDWEHKYHAIEAKLRDTEKQCDKWRDVKEYGDRVNVRGIPRMKKLVTNMERRCSNTASQFSTDGSE